MPSTAFTGPFLKTAGATQWAGTAIDNSTSGGWVKAGNSLQSYDFGGASGSGVLATVVFQARVKGNSALKFSVTKLRTWTGVPVPISHTNTGGWFNYLAGDVNGDGKVNQIDLYRLGRAYGSVPGSPNWNQDADINKDDAVNLSDLTLLNNNYGKT